MNYIYLFFKKKKSKLILVLTQLFNNKNINLILFFCNVSPQPKQREQTKKYKKWRIPTSI